MYMTIEKLHGLFREETSLIPRVDLPEYMDFLEKILTERCEYIAPSFPVGWLTKRERPIKCAKCNKYIQNLY